VNLCSVFKLLSCVCKKTQQIDQQCQMMYMLGSEMITFPDPKQPTFSTIASKNDNDISENPGPCSIDDVAISNLKGR
jgi:hypothetical protein